MEILRNSDTAIITTQVFEKDFSNNDCFLLGRIKFVTEDEITGEQIYKVRTDLVYYQDYTKIITPAVEEVRDQEDNIVIAGTPAVTELRQRLILSEEKQKWSEQKVSVDEYNAFNLAITPLVPEGMLPKQAENLKMQLVFLNQRKADAPWGTNDDWEVFNIEDLDRLKP
jgi:hypothetical protein